MKINPEVHKLDEALNPKNYDSLIKAVNNITGFDGEKYRSPSLVGEVGRAIKLVANRRIIYYIKEKMK